MGQASTAMYLLIYDEGTELAVESDLQAEVEVQLGMTLSIGRVSALLGIDPALGLDMKDRVRALRIDSWSQILVDLLDTHVVRLERTGAQFLFLGGTWGHGGTWGGTWGQPACFHF